jgi:hypothetical protein
MAELEIEGGRLIVHIQGVDRFLALATRVEVALSHISRVEVDPPDAHQAWHGLRMGGTNVPGVITAGRFVQSGRWAFWDVHDPSRSIAIYLHDESYARLVIGVEDPEVAASRIRAAISA